MSQNAMQQYMMMTAPGDVKDPSAPDARDLHAGSQQSVADDELLDVYEEDGLHVVGQQKRSIVHLNGLWHRVVACWVFDVNGRLLLARKRRPEVAEDLWDISSVRHPRAGESLEQACMRGLKEDYGLDFIATDASICGPLHRTSITYSDNTKDNQLIQSYSVGLKETKVEPASHDITDAIFVTLANLKVMVAENRHVFTQHFLQEAEFLNWFGNITPAVPVTASE